MEKNVYGVFDSNPELLAAIEDLKAKGVSGTQMTVAADIKKNAAFGNEHTDLLIIANQDKEDTLFFRIFHYFTDEGSGDLRSFFTEYGYFLCDKSDASRSERKKILFATGWRIPIEELKAGVAKLKK